MNPARAYSRQLAESIGERDPEVTEVAEKHGETEQRSPHGEEIVARATSGRHSRPLLTTKEPAKIQAIVIQGLHFRRLFRRQRPASRAGRTLNRLRVISVSSRLRVGLWPPSSSVPGCVFSLRPLHSERAAQSRY